MSGELQIFPPAPQHRRLVRLGTAAEQRVSMLLALPPDLDPLALGRVSREALHRHEGLRTHLQPIAGWRFPGQQIAESPDPTALAAWVDRSEGPAVRISATAAQTDRHGLRVVARELLDLWRGGQPTDEPLQLADVSTWLNGTLTDGDGARGRAYWARREEAWTRQTEPCLPDGFTPTRVPLPDAVSRALDGVESLPEAWALLAFQIALRRLGLAQGSALLLDGRSTPELAAVVGPLARVVPGPELRDLGRPAHEVVRELARELEERARWQDAWDPDRDLEPRTASALFEVVDDGELAILEEISDVEPYRLKLVVRRRAGAARLVLWGDPDRVDGERARRVGEALGAVLEHALAAPGTLLRDLPVVPRSTWPTPATNPIPFVPIPRAFAAAVEAHPAATAVRSAHATWTYRELAERVRATAGSLAAHGVGPTDAVAACATRSPETLVSLLAVLWTGAVWLPLDPGLPERRQRDMIRHAKPRAWLGSAPFDSPLPQIPLAERGPGHPAHDAHPSDRAYVLHTSGTTGRPRGIEVTHGALAHRIGWGQRADPLGPGDAVLQIASSGFDFSLWELLAPVCTGATVAFGGPDAHRDPLAMAEAVRAHGVSHLHLVPSLLRLCVHEPGFDGLRVVFSGGEALDPSTRDACLARWSVRLVNQYGPTECTIDVTRGPCEPGTDDVPIGVPMGGNTAYILDEDLQLLPAGQVGELFVSGPCLARGYLGDPRATAWRFFPDPFGAPGQRMYRTGDRCSVDADGVLRFFGRVDRQVQIGGVRVEPDALEAVLRSHEDVWDAAVVVIPETSVLAAFAAGSATPAELRSFVEQNLPASFMPQSITLLDGLPRGASGKIDRRRLAELATRPDGGGGVANTPLERQLCAMWAETLRVRAVGPEQDFFSLGGHSLLAIALVARIRRSLGVRLTLSAFFEASNVRALAAHVQTLNPSTAEVAPLVPDPGSAHEPFPLTDVQQAYWLGRQATFELGGVATHHYMEIDFETLDVHALQRAFRRLIARHAMLRAVVRADGTQQVLAEPPRWTLPVVDLAGAADLQRELDAIRAELSTQVLDPGTWPLFDVRVTHWSANRWRLHLSFDALIRDAFSAQLLLRELGALTLDPDRELAPLTLTFRDVVQHREAHKASPEWDRSRDYWLQRVPTLPGAPELPTRAEHAGPPRFERRTATLAPERWARLVALARSHALTPSAFLAGLYAEVLRRFSRTSAFLLNVTTFDRPPLHPEIQGVVGDFTSLTLLEVAPAEGLSLVARIRQLQDQLWKDLEHRAFTGVSVLRALRRAHGNHQLALAPVVFTSTLGAAQHTTEPGLDGEVVFSAAQTPQIWLDHQVGEIDGALVFNWDSVVGLFEPGIAEAMFEGYRTLLEALADGRSPLEASPAAVGRMVLPRDSIAVQEAINDTGGPLPEEALHAAFESRAAAHPERVAIVGEHGSLGYGEVDATANQVAHALRDRGVTRGDRVAVIGRKGPLQVIGALGVLKAGATYVPLAADLPPARIRVMLEDCGARVALTDGPLAELPDPVHEVRLGSEEVTARSTRPVPWTATPDDLAYVIYTSGSTGRPKGVATDHRGPTNTHVHISRRHRVGPDDAVLGLSSMSFDLSVYDVFGVLGAGGRLVLVGPEHLRDPEAWLDRLRRHRVTLWNTVPALMEMLVLFAEERGLDLSDVPLREVLLSGDWIPVDLPDRIRRLFPEARVTSLGGATEASIWSIAHPIEPGAEHRTHIPYGHPLTNQQVWVLDADLEPRPRHVVGEICIAGVGLAQGYLNRPERTAHAFVTRERDGCRMYRTGDLGRWNGRDTIEILGRIDQQVKLRGHRIELGEVEHALQAHPEVARAVAAIDDRAEPRLVAWFVRAQADADALPEAPLTDPDARAAFKLTRPALGPDHDLVALPEPDLDALAHRYHRRTTSRSFAPGPVPLADLAGWLATTLAVQSDDRVLPRYRIPSAGSLQAVQLWVYAREHGVRGLDAGLYYYHPERHGLHRAPPVDVDLTGAFGPSNAAVASQARVAVLLVAKLRVARVLYADHARDLCLVEAGYLAQALVDEAHEHHLGVCPIGRVAPDAFAPVLPAEGDAIAHALLLGRRAPRPDATLSRVPALPSRRPVGEAELRDHAARHLPAYMVPASIRPIDAVRMSANGKVDRAALLGSGPVAEPVPVAPLRTEAERRIADLVAGILEIPVERVGPERTFFELGATSLHLVRLHARLVESGQLEALSIADLFRHPTVRFLARHTSGPEPTGSAVDRARARAAERLRRRGGGS